MFLIFRLVGVFRMVLQKLIQDGHLEVRESLIDMNNTVLKVRLETRKENTKNSGLIWMNVGIQCVQKVKGLTLVVGRSQNFPSQGWPQLPFSIACCPCNNIYSVSITLGKCLFHLIQIPISGNCWPGVTVQSSRRKCFPVGEQYKWHPWCSTPSGLHAGQSVSDGSIQSPIQR